MMLGQAAVLMALCMVGLMNTKVSLVAPNPTPTTTTLVKQQNRVQPSIDGQATQRVKPTLNKGQFSRENERAKTTRKGPLRNTNTNMRNTLRNTIRRRKPTMVHPTSYLSLAISCHDAAIEVTTFRTS